CNCVIVIIWNFYDKIRETIAFTYFKIGEKFVTLDNNKISKFNIMKTNILGLPIKESELISAELNTLLANFQVYYQNLRGLHWNIRGKRFFDLHVKFEELYNDAQLKIDEIAERVLTIGGTPLHTFEEYIKE